MAAKNERVMEMVRREVHKNPDVPSQELFDKAKKMDSSIGRLDIRQFHASYPLQVKRLLKKSSGRRRGMKRAAPARRGPGRPRKTRAGSKTAMKTAKKTAKKAPVRRRRRTTATKSAAGTTAAPSRGGRDTVRSILIKFAGEVAAADQKADVVQVIGSMDRYVDQVMRAATA